MPKKAVNVEAGSVVFAFEDKSEQTFTLSKVSEEIAARLALHGASQKIGDSYAGAADEADPVAFAKAQVAGVIQQLYDGNWSSGGGGRGTVPTLVIAFAEFSKMELDKAGELIEAMSDDEKKALAKKPKLVAILARIRLERAQVAAQKAQAAADAEDEKAAA
jgi:hypothetical protein